MSLSKKITGIVLLKYGKSALFKMTHYRDFPGSPVVKAAPSNAGTVGLIPGQGVKNPHTQNQNIQQKRYCNKFNEKNFKNDQHKKIFLIKKMAH